VNWPAVVLAVFFGGLALAMWIMIARLAWLFWRLSKKHEPDGDQRMRILTLNATLMCVLALFFLAKFSADIAWACAFPEQPQQVEKRRGR